MEISKDLKQWYAIACPTTGVRFDLRTLELMDSDKDGRVRSPEVQAALMVEEGVGSALCLDSVTCTCEGGPLCFRPLEPRLEVSMVLVWRKYHAFSKAARKFLERLTGDRMLNLQLPGPDTLTEGH